MLTDLLTLLGLFKFCNIRRTQHMILLYTMEMVHPIQMYLWYLLLIFKWIIFGFVFSEKTSSCFTFLTLLPSLFCKTVLSAAPTMHHLLFFFECCRKQINRGFRNSHRNWKLNAEKYLYRSPLRRISEATEKYKMY